MGKLRITSEPKGPGESDSVSEPPYQGPVLRSMSKPRRRDGQNGGILDMRSPITGESELPSLPPIPIDLKRLNSRSRLVKPFTQFRKNKIQTFNNENCLHPGQPLFGKMGSAIWVDRLIKFLNTSSRVEVKAIDVLMWLNNFSHFFRMEHGRVRAEQVPPQGPGNSTLSPEANNVPGTSASLSSGSTKAPLTDSKDPEEGARELAPNSAKSQTGSELRHAVRDPVAESYGLNSNGELVMAATPATIYYDQISPSVGVFGLSTSTPQPRSSKQDSRRDKRDPCFAPFEPIGNLIKTVSETDQLQQEPEFDANVGGFNFMPPPIFDVDEDDDADDLPFSNGTHDPQGDHQMGQDGLRPPVAPSPSRVVDKSESKQSHGSETQTEPVILFIADPDMIPATRQNMNVFATALIKLVDKAQRDGTCPEINLDVCYHIMQSMRACIDGAGKV